MTNSRLFDFVRARPAILMAGVLAIIFVVGLAGALRPKRATTGAPLFTNSPPGEVTSLVRPSVPMPAVQAKPVAPANSPAQPTNKPFEGLHYHANLPPETNLRPLGLYAPAGRLLRCQLVNTVDSASIDTPIIALVTHDLWHDGKLVVPVGTEVHGKAAVDRLRERIVASGNWTLVWQSGQELVVPGIALDRDVSPSGGAWGISDGSAGLRGQILRSDSLAEIKLFIATFMAGAASGLKEQRATLLGDQIARTTRNYALEGAGQVMSTYAQQILDAIHRDGIFVRVPAGKEMYLYLTRTIDVSEAKQGHLRVTTPLPAAFGSVSAITNKP